ncbi:MAG: type I restriction-modification system subunit M [Lachnospiraceae bacterium]|nr:type I restriction-modification system subunit M [Lachnospiraceae bacterium]
MNKQQLASLVWDTCNDLRGSISAVEYKDIILGFIFYRFVSENEVSHLMKYGWTMEIMAEELTEDDTETVNQCKEHLGYFIAYKNLFSTWKNYPESFTVANVSDALNAFVRNIGSKADYQKLYNEIFKSLSDKLSKMGTITEQTSHLKKLIKIIGRIPMDENQGYDVLGFIYEFLLKNFASNSKKDGEFYTPHEISVLMSELVAHHVKDREQICVLDPTSGSGSLLINIGQSVQKYLHNGANITYYAQELIQETYNLTRMNLVMRGIKPNNIKVRRGDTLSNDWPYFDDNDENSYKYVPVDCVVSNPPYSKKWNADSHINDPRYKDYGIAPASKADYAFLLHDLYHLRDDGIMCIVMPHGVLFRGGSEQEIRTQLVENNNIETIIGLPANCFYGTGIPTIIMVLKKHREESDILFVDASKEFYKDGNKNRLSGHHIKKIVDAVLTRETIPHFATRISKQTVIQNEYNLNIPRYVESEEKVPVDLHATMFGGIPNYEIDHLEHFWKSFPSLREELFRCENEHTSKVKCDSILDAIKANRDVQTFDTAYTEAFCSLEQWLYDLLIENPVENVHAIKAEITNRIFELCKDFDIVDRYIVYKAFDEKWEQISIDLEAIRLQGLGVAREVEIIEVYDKKEGDAVPKDEEGKVIPFALIQKHLFPDEFIQMETLNRELADVITENDSFWEELDEELKDELKKKSDDEQADSKLDSKILKKKYQEILDTLSNDVTKLYDSYLGLKPKEKLAFQQDHTELIWPEETEKGKNGVYKPAAVKVIIEQIKNNIEIAEDEDDYKMRHLYLIGQQISELKKQIKILKIDLDIKAREAIKSLSDDEIKMLLKEKWLTPAMQSINDIPASIVDEINRSIQGIIAKYQNPISTLDTKISDTEKELAMMLKELSGNDFDMAAIRQFKKLLGGEDNE